MDPQRQFCHNPDCSARGQVGQGNITLHSQKEQRYRCTACGRTFTATMGPPCYRLRTAVDVVTLVLPLLCHGCPLQALVAAFGCDERTVAQWQARGGRPCRHVHGHLVQRGQGDLGPVQADELWIKMVGKRVGMALACGRAVAPGVGGGEQPTSGPRAHPHSGADGPVLGPESGHCGGWGWLSQLRDGLPARLPPRRADRPPRAAAARRGARRAHRPGSQAVCPAAGDQRGAPRGTWDHRGHRGSTGRHRWGYRHQYSLYRAAPRHLSERSGASGAPGAGAGPYGRGANSGYVSGRLCLPFLLVSPQSSPARSHSSAAEVAGADAGDSSGLDRSLWDHAGATELPGASTGLGSTQAPRASSQTEAPTGDGRGGLTNHG